MARLVRHARASGRIPLARNVQSLELTRLSRNHAQKDQQPFYEKRVP
jgi:hypothetical protein